MSYLKFCVRNQYFVISIAFIDQIIPYVNPIELGDNKEAFHELINLRGEIIPCLDFSYFVNKNKSDVHLNTRIIILKLQSKENEIKKIGLIAESVIEICQIEESDFLTISLNSNDELFIKRNIRHDQMIIKEIDVIKIYNTYFKSSDFESK